MIRKGRLGKERSLQKARKKVLGFTEESTFSKEKGIQAWYLTSVISALRRVVRSSPSWSTYQDLGQREREREREIILEDVAEIIEIETFF
jgi:hypothetical protein